MILRKLRLFLALIFVRLHWQPADETKPTIILPLPMPEKLNCSGPTTYCLACCLATFSVNAAKPEFSPMIQSVLLSSARDFGAPLFATNGGM